MSVLLAAIVAIIINFEKLKAVIYPPEPQVDTVLVVDYWRMTGAFQVPFFLKMGPEIARCDDPNATGIDQANCEYSSSIGEVWRTELKDAKLVQDGPIDFDDLHFGIKELWKSNFDPDVASEIYCAVKTMDGGIELSLNTDRRLTRRTLDSYLGTEVNSDRLLRPVSQDAKCSGLESQAVGYIIMRIQNVADKIATDVNMSFARFSAKGPKRIDAYYGEVNDEILMAFDRYNPETLLQLVDAPVSAAVKEHVLAAIDKQSDVRFPSIKPGESLLVPIALYRARPDRFEAYFYRDWRMPSTIEFRSNGTNFRGEVRLPKRGTGAVIRTYGGWYQQ